MSPASRMSRKEVAAELENKAYWQELAEAVGWSLYGWTRREGASFFTKSQWPGDPNPGLIHVTCVQRDDILNAIRQEGRPMA